MMLCPLSPLILTNVLGMLIEGEVVQDTKPSLASRGVRHT